jgi:hypothetical protein
MLYSTPSSRHGPFPGQAHVMSRFFDNDSDDHDDRDDDDTIEMELTPDQMRVLAEAAGSWASDEGDESARTPAVTTPDAMEPTKRQSAAPLGPASSTAVDPATNHPPAAPVLPATAPSWPTAPSRRLTHSTPVPTVAPAAFVAPVVTAPEIVITVDIGPVVVRPASPASSAAGARAPIVIEHTPVKLKPLKPAAAPMPPQRSRLNSHLRGALVAGVVAIAAFLSTIAYVAVTKARPVAMPVFIPAPQLPRETVAQTVPVVEAIPVRFANPFDQAEVFEFPPGTTEAQARDAVAAVLLQRGQDRLAQVEAAQRRSKRAAHDSLRRNPTKLASRS